MLAETLNKMHLFLTKLTGTAKQTEERRGEEGARDVARAGQGVRGVHRLLLMRRRAARAARAGHAGAKTEHGRQKTEHHGSGAGRAMVSLGMTWAQG